MSARDASGVPAELRELFGLLSQLAQLPPRPGDRNWDRYRDVQSDRSATLRVILRSVSDATNNYAKHPSHAREALARDCQHWTRMARERLAEPLGYEPAPEAQTGGAE